MRRATSACSQGASSAGQPARCAPVPRANRTRATESAARHRTWRAYIEPMQASAWLGPSARCRPPGRCAVCRSWAPQPVCQECIARFAPRRRAAFAAAAHAVAVAQCGACLGDPPPRTLHRRLRLCVPWDRLITDPSSMAGWNWPRCAAPARRRAAQDRCAAAMAGPGALARRGWPTRRSGHGNWRDASRDGWAAEPAHLLDRRSPARTGRTGAGAATEESRAPSSPGRGAASRCRASMWQ